MIEQPGSRKRDLRLLAMAAMLAALGGCSTATPVLVQGTSLPPLQGRVNTTAGYTGNLTTDNKTCRGSFTGVPGQPLATFEISCNDGRSGIGTATLAGRAFVSGEVRLNDGSRLTVRQSGPVFP